MCDDLSVVWVPPPCYRPRRARTRHPRLPPFCTINKLLLSSIFSSDVDTDPNLVGSVHYRPSQIRIRILATDPDPDPAALKVITI